MTLFLLLLLGISTHNVQAAAFTQSYLSASEQMDRNNRLLKEHVYPVTATQQGPPRSLEETNASNVVQVFSRYTNNIVKLNERLRREVDNYSAVLSSDYIDELIHHAKNRTISVQDLRTEVARCALGIAERICFERAPSSPFISIEEIQPISKHYIYGKEELTQRKALMMTDLLYAVCYPASATHISVYNCLYDLGFFPKIKPLDTSDAETSGESDEESYTFAAENIYELIAEELTFIKSHLPYLVPNDARVSADPSYYRALLNCFRVTQRECQEEPAAEKTSFYFDTRLAKVLLILDQHYSNYIGDNIEVVDFADLIRWRFRLFTNMKA